MTMTAGGYNALNADGYVRITVIEGNAYTINLPSNIVANGITARVTSSNSVYIRGTTVTLTINLSGTAELTAEHSVRVRSIKANLNPAIQTRIVNNRQNVNANHTFTFTMPAQNVNDIILEHTFRPMHKLLIEVDKNLYTHNDSDWNMID